MCVYSVLLWLPPVFKCCYLGVSSALLPRCRWGATAPRPQWAGSSVMCCLRSRTSLWVLSSSSSMQWAPPLLCDPANKGKHTWNKSSLPFIIINVNLFKMLRRLFCERVSITKFLYNVRASWRARSPWPTGGFCGILTSERLQFCQRGPKPGCSHPYFETLWEKNKPPMRDDSSSNSKWEWCICYLCEQRQRRAATACLCFRTAARWRCGHWCDPSGWAGGWIGRWTWKYPPSPSSPHAWYKAAKDIDDLRGEKSLEKLTDVILRARGGEPTSISTMAWANFR